MNIFSSKQFYLLQSGLICFVFNFCLNCAIIEIESFCPFMVRLASSVQKFTSVPMDSFKSSPQRNQTQSRKCHHHPSYFNFFKFFWVLFIECILLVSMLSTSNSKGFQVSFENTDRLISYLMTKSS